MVMTRLNGINLEVPHTTGSSAFERASELAPHDVVLTRPI
jgi:hypothetical protein